MKPRVVPDGVSAGDVLTDVEEIRQAWDGRFIVPADEETGEPEHVVRGDDPRVVYTASAVYVRASVSIHIGAYVSEWLRIEEPTVGALKAAERVKGEVSKATAILAVMIQAPGADLDRLKSSDLVRISEIMGNFQ